jgi:hypothetical protein
MDVGDKRASFRVETGKGVEPGTYKIKWLTEGDSTPSVYAPLDSLNVVVASGRKATIDVATIPQQPISSTSVPIPITLSTAPLSEITVTIEFENEVTGVTISKKTHKFSKGTNESTFQIEIGESKPATDPVLKFTISGNDSELFAMDRS